jgi:hypothetical protein
MKAFSVTRYLYLGARSQAVESAPVDAVATWTILRGHGIGLSVTDQGGLYVGVLPVTAGTGHRCVVLRREKFTARSLPVRGIRCSSF